MNVELKLMKNSKELYMNWGRILFFQADIHIWMRVLSYQPTIDKGVVLSIIIDSR